MQIYELQYRVVGVGVRSEGPASKSSYFLGDPPPDPRFLASLGALSLAQFHNYFDCVGVGGVLCTLFLGGSWIKREATSTTTTRSSKRTIHHLELAADKFRCIVYSRLLKDFQRGRIYNDLGVVSFKNTVDIRIDVT